MNQVCKFFRSGLWVLWLALAACSVKNTGSTGGVQTTAEVLRILTYNIHHCNPPSKPDFIDVEAIAKVIRAQQPDLVALQEVDVNTLRSGKDQNQAALLGAKTGMHHYFAKAIDLPGGGEYGVAILSRFPLLETGKYDLPFDPEMKSEQRILATVRVKTSVGQEFIFASTHLDHQKKENNRVLQVAEINRLLGNQQLPVVLAGDFNAVPGSQTIQILDAQFQRSCTECAFTIPQVNPNRAIDFIAFAPTRQFSVLRHEVIAEPYASDHLPVFSLLQLHR